MGGKKEGWSCQQQWYIDADSSCATKSEGANGRHNCPKGDDERQEIMVQQVGIRTNDVGGSRRLRFWRNVLLLVIGAIITKLPGL